jgi:hypothetical protein
MHLFNGVGSPSLSKKVPQQDRTFIRKTATGKHNCVIVGGIAQKVKFSTSSACFGVISSKHDTFQPCVDHGPRAHRARFQCHIQGTRTQAMVAKQVPGFTHGYNFCMC